MDIEEERKPRREFINVQTGLDAFIGAARDAVAQAPATSMLTPGIATNYANGVNTLSGEADVIVRGEAGDNQTACRAALFATDAKSFSSSENLWWCR